MTGFGDAACEVDSVHYAVELRSLNNRYFKATIRLSRGQRQTRFANCHFYPAILSTITPSFPFC